MTWQEKNKEFDTLLNQLFQGNDWQERSEAAHQLGLMEDGRAVNLLCRALRAEKEGMVQNRIIEALGRIGDARATLRIIEKLKEEFNKDDIDKFRVIYMLESLMKIKDKRALVYIGPFLNSPDKDLKKLAEDAFDVIEPDWRQIVARENGARSIEEIFNIKM